MKKRFIIIYILIFLAGLYVNLHADIAVPTAKPLSQFPSSFGDWRMRSEFFMDERTLAVLKPSDYLSRTYVNGAGKEVTLYIGYHGGGKNTGELHSPKHCLPGSGWFEISSRTEKAVIGGKPLNLVRAVYRKGESKEVFLYWFQVADEALTSEYILKLSQIKNSLLHRRRDATFVRISVPCSVDDEANAAAEGMKFISATLPAVREFLPK